MRQPQALSRVPAGADTRRPLALAVVRDQVEESLKLSIQALRGSSMMEVNFSLALRIWSDYYDREEKRGGFFWPHEREGTKIHMRKHQGISLQIVCPKPQQVS